MDDPLAVRDKALAEALAVYDKALAEIESNKKMHQVFLRLVDTSCGYGSGLV